MKQLLQGIFLSLNYQQILYNQFEHCKQGTRIVATYTEKFYRLSSQCELSMTDEQHTAKYISGLKYPIQERVILHDVFSVNEAHNKAMKIERLHIRAPLFRRLMSIDEPLGRERVQPSSATADQPLAQLTAKAPMSTPTTNPAVAKGK